VPGSFVWLFGCCAHPALPRFLALQSWFLQPLHLIPPQDSAYLYIVGTTLLNTTFFVTFVLTNSRAAEAFIWVFEKLREVYRELELDLPRTLVTGLEEGLVIPIREVFPEASHLLCIWHINEDIKTWALAKLTAIEELNRDTPPKEISTVVQGKLNEFLAYWSPVVNASTEAAFDDALEILTTAYVKTFPAVLVYLDDTWLKDHKRKFVLAWT
jgi:MULE transposase domain